MVSFTESVLMVLTCSSKVADSGGNCPFRIKL